MTYIGHAGLETNAAVLFQNALCFGRRAGRLIEPTLDRDTNDHHHCHYRRNHDDRDFVVRARGDGADDRHSDDRVDDDVQQLPVLQQWGCDTDRTVRSNNHTAKQSKAEAVYARPTHGKQEHHRKQRCERGEQRPRKRQDRKSVV